jgi:formylglycine-generating enzyme required for sulfatase activity
MGSPESEAGRGTDESPVHTVSLSPFLIAKYEVTQNEYKTVMQMPPPGVNDDPSSVKGDDLPVESVSWNDLLVADGFLERTGLSLPNEAQWEYAARAGTPEPYSGTASVDDMGWYDDNSDDEPHEVGTKQPNQFGLHDMHGNVYEWCEDVYKEAYYSDEVPGEPDLSTETLGFRPIRRLP